MSTTRSVLDADWLGICRRAVDGPRTRCSPTRRASTREPQETGSRGSGGDRTLVIDRSAELVVVAELDALKADGYRFRRSPRSSARSTTAIPACA